VKTPGQVLKELRVVFKQIKRAEAKKPSPKRSETLKKLYRDVRSLEKEYGIEE
jgi:hypothetical protein